MTTATTVTTTRHTMKCMLCNRRIAAPLPTGESVGPTCASKVGMLPPITRRVVRAIDRRRAYRDIAQVDWVESVGEAAPVATAAQNPTTTQGHSTNSES